MKFFTSDIHFGDALDVASDGRQQFKNDKQYEKYIIKTWNKQAKKGDTIYVIGDMFDCHSKTDPYYKKELWIPKKVKADIVLVIGNNEERIINNFYDGDFEKFKKDFQAYGIKDCLKDGCVTIFGQDFYMTHKPINHSKDMLTLFGHCHRAMGVYKSFGFNIGCDLNHFRLFSEGDIQVLLDGKRKYWDAEEDLRLI